jgi:hypothetical protein
MGVDFTKLAGELNPNTHFISSALDLVKKSCCCRCFCPAPSGEGSFDREDVATSIETSIRTRVAELNTMNEVALGKIKENVVVLSKKLSRMGACIRVQKDLRCEASFKRAIATLGGVIEEKNRIPVIVLTPEIKGRMIKVAAAPPAPRNSFSAAAFNP